MTITRQATVELDPRVPAIHIAREFDAPPAAVFRAHAEPELFAQWFGPHGSEVRIEHHECRTGGSYRFVHVVEGQEYGFFGSFHEVRPDELIVQTFGFEPEPDHVALERLRLVALDGGRARLVATSMTETFEARDGWVASGMGEGLQQTYERLDALLAR